MKTVKITESDLTKIIRRVIKEQTEMPDELKLAFKDAMDDAGYFDSEETGEELSVDEPLEDLPVEKTDSDWTTIGEFFKDYYTNVRERFSGVTPNEFDEITILINGIVSLAGDINLDNKNANVIVQELSKRIQDDIKSDS
mgnify:FL=1